MVKPNARLRIWKALLFFEERSPPKNEPAKTFLEQIKPVSQPTPALKSFGKVSVLGLLFRILGTSQILYMEFCGNFENDDLPWIVLSMCMCVCEKPWWFPEFPLVGPAFSCPSSSVATFRTVTCFKGAQIHCDCFSRRREISGIQEHWRIIECTPVCSHPLPSEEIKYYTYKQTLAHLITPPSWQWPLLWIWYLLGVLYFY